MRRIYDLHPYGDSGWSWEENDGHEYRTDAHGYGLWHLAPTASVWFPEGAIVYEWKQIAGTGQYRLPMQKDKARAKIYRDIMQRVKEQSL